MKNAKGQEHQSERDKKIATTEQDKSECILQASIFYYQQKATSQPCYLLYEIKIVSKAHMENSSCLCSFINTANCKQTVCCMNICIKAISKDAILWDGTTFKQTVLILLNAYFSSATVLCTKFRPLWTKKRMVHEKQNPTAFKRELILHIMPKS